MKRLHVVPAMAGDVVREVFRRKEFYIVLILGAALVLLLSSVDFFGGVSATSHVKEMAVQLMMISTIVLTLTVTARQLPAERERRTLFTLLAKPVTRAQFLGGKWLGSFLGAALAVTVFWILFLAMIAVGHGHPFAPIYLQGYLFFLALAAVCVSIALFFSTFLTYGANVTLGLLLCPAFLWWGRQIAASESWQRLPAPVGFLLQNLLPHLEFFDLRTVIVYQWDPLRWTVVLAVVAYTLTYSAILFAGAWAVFSRKPLVSAT